MANIKKKRGQAGHYFRYAAQMDNFSATNAMLNETGNQHQAARNQGKIEQLKNCSLNALHIERRDAHYHQANMADAGVSQQAAQISLLQCNHGGVDKGNRTKNTQYPGIFNGRMGR